MKRIVAMCGAMALILAAGSVARADYHVTFDFETSWTGDFVPGWEQEGYRHGDAPLAVMEQVDLTSYGGTGDGLKLRMESVATSSQWWGGVRLTGTPHHALRVEYDPWVQVEFYDHGYTSGRDVTGQLYTLPSWVVDDDWTDVQFGGRTVAEGYYYYTWADRPHPDWQATTVSRPDLDKADAATWHTLKIQLLSTDNMMHFYIDGAQVGTSTRSDYTDLGGLILMNMFDDPLSEWGDNKPFTVWDNFEAGSTYIPAPPAVVLGAIGLGLVAVKRRLRRRRRA